jgi:hypothetical protein
MSPLYEHENFGDVQRYVFMKGIITSVDSEYDTADVTIPGGTDGSEIPLFYHCSDDAEERSNGAIEGAAAGFSAGAEDDPTDGDEVIVMYDVEDNEAVRIIGFVDGIKVCAFQFRIIRVYDEHVATDAMTEYDGEWRPDDFPICGSVIYFRVYSNLGMRAVFYGHNTLEDWEFYHPDEDIDDYNPECMATYNEDTKVWTIPIPEEIRDPAGYLVTTHIADSINTQFLTPVPEDEEEPEPYYPYVWKIEENELEYPYVLQEYPEEDEEHEGYMNLAIPGAYDFFVPCFRHLDGTIDPDLVYGDVEDGLPYKTGNSYFWEETTLAETGYWESDLPCIVNTATVNARVYPLGYPVPDPYNPPDPPDVNIAIVGPGLSLSVTNVIPRTTGPVVPVAANPDAPNSCTVTITLTCPTATYYRAFSYRFDALMRTNLIIDYT